MVRGAVPEVGGRQASAARAHRRRSYPSVSTPTSSRFWVAPRCSFGSPPSGRVPARRARRRQPGAGQLLPGDPRRRRRRDRRAARSIATISALYYRVRRRDPAKLSPTERAARLIYLNRCGYNGLYRVNSSGQFNVPFGRYLRPVICDEDRLRAASAALQKARDRLRRLRAHPEEASAPATSSTSIRRTFRCRRRRRSPPTRSAQFGSDDQERLADVLRALGGAQGAGAAVELGLSRRRASCIAASTASIASRRGAPSTPSVTVEVPSTRFWCAASTTRLRTLRPSISLKAGSGTGGLRRRQCGPVDGVTREKPGAEAEGAKTLPASRFSGAGSCYRRRRCRAGAPRCSPSSLCVVAPSLGVSVAAGCGRKGPGQDRRRRDRRGPEGRRRRDRDRRARSSPSTTPGASPTAPSSTARTTRASRSTSCWARAR